MPAAGVQAPLTLQLILKRTLKTQHLTLKRGVKTQQLTIKRTIKTQQLTLKRKLASNVQILPEHWLKYDGRDSEFN